MQMVIGGSCQGKTAYAMKLTGLSEEEFIDGADCPEDCIWTARAVKHLHLYIRRFLSAAEEPDRAQCRAEEFAEKLFMANPGLVIVTDEIGYGIIPADPADREWREMTGRVCTALAARSERVDRVVCGIGMRLKQQMTPETVG